jgi:hypothetical protein
MANERDADGVLHCPPIHEWFGLSYSNYFVMPRLAIQDLPHDWQRRFIALIDEAYDVHGMETPAYHVLRQGSDYTIEVREDPDDEKSDVLRYLPVREDPWANYRRGRAADLVKEEDA